MRVCEGAQVGLHRVYCSEAGPIVDKAAMQDVLEALESFLEPHRDPHGTPSPGLSPVLDLALNDGRRHLATPTAGSTVSKTSPATDEAFRRGVELRTRGFHDSLVRPGLCLPCTYPCLQLAPHQPNMQAKAETKKCERFG